MTDHAWFWPQYVMAVLYAFSMLNGCVETLRNKKLSSIGVTLTMFLVVAVYVMSAWVLHCGGFW